MSSPDKIQNQLSLSSKKGKMEQFKDWILLGTIFIALTTIVLVVYFMMNKQQNIISKLLERDVIQQNLELKRDRQKMILPQRIDAYQRFILYLSRITPGTIVFRFHDPSMPAKKIQMDVLTAIREEFEHNVAQQMFVSEKAWKIVKDAKEETIRIVNLAGDSCSPTATSLEYATKVMEIAAEVGQLPTEIACNLLRKELQELF